jgi:histidinol phosphatase-like enzyme (inositol monophosphatase family)
MQREARVALSDDEIRYYLGFLDKLADASGAAIMPHFRQSIEVEDKGTVTWWGGTYDPVTVADKAAETAIRTLIKEHHPDHGIWGEEEGFEKGSSPLVWVIDPIDGTRAFITGLPVWGTLIALNDGTRPVVGVMDQPFTRERFLGWGTGARLGDRKLATRPCASIAEARLMTTDPRMFADGPERDAFDSVYKRARMARYGGDCYAYCMLAMGFVDLVIEGSLQAYDVQALIPIVEGAGGRFTSWTGGPADQGGFVVAAGDPRVHDEALKLLSGYAT